MTYNYSRNQYNVNGIPFESSLVENDGKFRTLEGIPTYISFNSGSIDANESVSWHIDGTIEVHLMMVSYVAAPSGSLSISMVYPSGTTSNISLGINTVGTKFDNAWRYDWEHLVIPAGTYVTLTPSVAVTAVTCMAKPALLLAEVNAQANN